MLVNTQKAPLIMNAYSVDALKGIQRIV